MSVLGLVAAVGVALVVVSALDRGVRNVFRLEVWDYHASWRRFLRRYHSLA